MSEYRVTYPCKTCSNIYKNYAGLVAHTPYCGVDMTDKVAVDRVAFKLFQEASKTYTQSEVDEMLRQQREQDYTEAKNLAIALWKKHYSDVPQWKPLGTVSGVISQIDNMTCGLVLKSPLSARIGEADE